MATISLGKIALTWRSAYDVATSYSGQDVVSFGGSTYISKTGSVGLAPTDASRWDLLAQGVEGITSIPGELVYFDGSQLQPLPIGSAGNILKVGTDGMPVWGVPEQRSGMRAIKVNDSRMPHMYRRGLALMSDGTVRMWGRQSSYTSGGGTYQADRAWPIRVAFPPTAGKMIYACHQYDTMAVSISEYGKLWTWGSNEYGFMGTGNGNNSYAVPYCPSDNSANSIFGKTVIDYAPCVSNDNYSSTLVLCSDGTVHAAGYNGYGQVGQGDTGLKYNFVQVPLLSNIVKIARGRERYTSCYALKDDGTMYAWGYNDNGQLGLGNFTQMNIPMQMMYFTNNSIVIADMGAGHTSAWAIDNTGVAYTWGLNNYGQLGYGGTTRQETPSPVMTDVATVYMKGGDYHSTALIKNDGSVWATGANNYGALCVGADTTVRSSFQECLKGDGTGFTNATQVQLGGTGSYNYTVVLDTEGVLWSGGYNGNGQLGLGSTATSYWLNPVLIHRRKVADYCMTGTGSEGGMNILLDDGQVMSTGYGGQYMQADGTGALSPTPTPVPF